MKRQNYVFISHQKIQVLETSIMVKLILFSINMNYSKNYFLGTLIFLSKDELLANL